MKKIIRVLLTTTLVIALAGCGAKEDSADKDSAGKKDKLIVGTEAGFAPYEYMKGNDIVGIDMDIAKAIADEMGRELEIKNMDFDGALAAAQSGKVDFVAAGVSISEERKDKVDFSIEYVNNTDVVVVNKEASAVTPAEGDVKGSDLDGKVIGVQQGNIADNWVSDEENVKPGEVKRYTKFAQAAEDLKNKKIDCIIMDQYPAQDLVDGNESLMILKGTLFEDKYAIGVKKGDKELLETINKVIQKLIDDGKIEEFTKNHVGQK